MTRSVRNNSRRYAHFIYLLIFMGLALLGCKGKKQGAESQPKILNTGLPSDIKGFDPVITEDRYTNRVVAQIYEPLYQYAYLKRPYQVEPLLADGMPTVSADHLTYDIKIKPGVFFTAHPAFGKADAKGVYPKREVTAADFVYSLKRLADPRTGTTGYWLLKDRVVGVDAFYKKLAELGRKEPNLVTSGYDNEIEGISAPEKYLLRLRLIRPFPQFVHALAMVYTAVVAREVAEYYGKEFPINPVGTGPYKLLEWRRDLKIVLTRNPDVHPMTYPSEGEPADQQGGLLAAAGKALPFVEQIHFQVFRESRPMWLNFLKGNLDASGIPKDGYDQAIDKQGKLRQELVSKGLQVKRDPQMNVTFLAFNMRDPLLGQKAGEKGKWLRQAISRAWNSERVIELFYNGRAIPAQGPVPPGLSGYDEKLQNPSKQYDLEAAKALLAKAGYPGGKGLPQITIEERQSTEARQMGEMLTRDLEAIGIKARVNFNSWTELLAKANKNQAQVVGMAWGADYPDAENFLMLFYGPNGLPGPNFSNYNDPAYNQMYEQLRVMEDSPARTELIGRMVKKVIEDTPWVFGAHMISEVLWHGWLKNYKPGEVGHNLYKYYDIDLDRKAELKGKL